MYIYIHTHTYTHTYTHTHTHTFTHQERAEGQRDGLRISLRKQPIPAVKFSPLVRDDKVVEGILARAGNFDLAIRYNKSLANQVSARLYQFMCIQSVYACMYKFMWIPLICMHVCTSVCTYALSV
jgi:hypothetical protein